MSRRLFGTDGVRGILNESIDPVMAMKLSMSVCTVIGEGSNILLGRDVRLGGEILELAVATGLLNSGCRPYIAGLTPTPALQLYISRSGGFEAGLMITASHNPPEYNGIKLIMSDGIEAPREVEEEVEEVFFDEKYKKVSWNKASTSTRSVSGVNEFYVNEVVRLVDAEKIRRKGLKVVIDAANSVGSLTLPEIVRRLGGKPIVINGNLDPFMSGREPEPTVDSLKEASSVVRELRADVGVGVDGDADRAVVIDEKGTVQWGDRTAVVIAPFLREKHPELPPRVYTGISSSSFIEPLLKKHGISVVWLKVGSPIIARALKNEGGLLGFEENGGIMYPVHQPVRDSGAALALIMELLAMTNKNASELYSIYPRTFMVKTKVPRGNIDLSELYMELEQRFEHGQYIRVDGLKLVMDDTWVLIRPSGTEPVIRIMVESLSKEKAEEILKTVKSIIEELSKN
jgi:phosphomannomutase/phosphoglucomutase